MAQRISRAAASVLGVATIVAPGLAQTPPAAQRPVYRSEVDVVVVDVSVIDSAGRPVRDLTTADFDVRVDGKPRRTLSAELVDYEPAARPPGSVESAQPGRATSKMPRMTQAEYSSNEGVVAGRSVLLIVDLGSFRPGEERRAMVTAGEFLETLSPNDRVAVAQIPLRDSVLGFTTDREQIRTTLQRFVGMRLDPSVALNFGIAEALRIARGDQSAWRELVLRECPMQATVALPTGQTAMCSEAGLEPECPCAVQHRMRSEVNTVVRAIRYEAERQVRGILDLLEALRQVSGRKIVVILSQGIFLDDLPFGRAALAVAASRADARVDVIQVEQNPTDASSRQQPRDQFQEVQMARAGLGDLAEMLGGAVYRAIGSVPAQLERIWSENASGWRLGIEPDRLDLDGKPHRLEVKVKRSGLTVYSRSHFIIEGPAHRTDSADDRLRAALQSPLPATALPVRLTHYVTYDRTRGDVVVRLVAEMPATKGAGVEPKIAFVVVDAKGRQVAVATREMNDKQADGRDEVRFSGQVALKPGGYLLRFAALGADGRIGSVDRRLELVEPPPDGVALGDVVVAELSDDPSAAVDPVVLPSVSKRQLIAYVELFPPAGQASSSGDVAFEIARGPAHEVLASVRGSIRPGRDGQPSSALAAMSLGKLPEGEYAARAVLNTQGTRVEGNWRTFRLVGSAAGAGASAASVPSSGAALAHQLPPLVDAFDTRAVLGGDVMRRMVSLLQERPAAGDRGVAAALTRAASGQFDAEAEIGAIAAKDPTVAAMLQGFDRLAAGRADQAVSLFKDALRESPDLTAALVYVGACYAAGGHDREAAGAWQVAIIEQRDLPSLYAMLADALVRMGEAERAADVLARATKRWPTELSLRRRLAVAFASAGKRDQALAEIDGALAVAPGDAETACSGFRLDVETAQTVDAQGSQRRRGYAQACATGSSAVSGFASKWLQANGGAPQ